MSRTILEQIKSYYQRGIYKISQIDAMLSAGKITDAEYRYIVGENS